MSKRRNSCKIWRLIMQHCFLATGNRNVIKCRQLHFPIILFFSKRVNSLLVSYAQTSSNFTLICWSVSSVSAVFFPATKLCKGLIQMVACSVSGVSTLFCLSTLNGQANTTTSSVCTTITAFTCTTTKPQFQTCCRCFILCHQLVLQNPSFIVEPSTAIWIRKCRTRLTGHLPHRDLVGGWIALGGVDSASCVGWSEIKLLWCRQVC